MFHRRPRRREDEQIDSTALRSQRLRFPHHCDIVVEIERRRYQRLEITFRQMHRRHHVAAISKPRTRRTEKRLGIALFERPISPRQVHCRIPSRRFRHRQNVLQVILKKLDGDGPVRHDQPITVIRRKREVPHVKHGREDARRIKTVILVEVQKLQVADGKFDRFMLQRPSDNHFYERRIA